MVLINNTLRHIKGEKYVFWTSIVEFYNMENCELVISKWFQTKAQSCLGLGHESNIWNFNMWEYTFVSNLFNQLIASVAII